MLELDKRDKEMVEQALLRAIHRVMLWPKDPHRALTLKYEPHRVVGKLSDDAVVETLSNGNLNLIKGNFYPSRAYVVQRHEDWVEQLPNGEYRRLPTIKKVGGKYVEFLADGRERALNAEWIDCHKEHRRVGTAYVHFNVGENPLEAIVAVEEAFERDIIGLLKPIEPIVNYALSLVIDELHGPFKRFVSDKVEKAKRELHYRMRHWCVMFLFFLIDEVERRVKCALGPFVREFYHEMLDEAVPTWDEIIAPSDYPHCAYSKWLKSHECYEIPPKSIEIRCKYAKDLLSRLRQQLNEYKSRWEASFRFYRV